VLSTIHKNGNFIGLHGYHHVDYAKMSLSEQSRDIRKGMAKLEEIGLRTTGFRAPFLRFNAETGKAAHGNGITWVSHSTVFFDQTDLHEALAACESARRVLGKFYRTGYNSDRPSLPKWGTYGLEIPVSLPDDELLVDRLGFCDEEKLAEVWLEMLRFSSLSGELLNLVFHPERTDLFIKPLEQLISVATSDQDIWVSSLDQIAGWWQERKAYHVEILGSRQHIFKVAVHPGARDTVALQHPGGKLQFLSPKADNTIDIKTSYRPSIAVTPGCNEEAIGCLMNDGFLLEDNVSPDNAAFVLDAKCPKEHSELLDAVKKARGPLLRLWRWPHQCKSALAISVDVDAITIWDFLRRALHFTPLYYRAPKS
jgi:peptidoglycan/xylan/chitin deacetylase (PgdA/CDA1 family)